VATPLEGVFATHTPGRARFIMLMRGSAALVGSGAVLASPVS
jgi:hypothetical protein